jgi:hypothetical protein
MTFDTEKARLAGQESKKHSVYAIEARGEAAMNPDQAETFLEIEQSLETSEGIVLAMRRRVAMSLMVVGVLENYLEKQVNAGVSPDGIPIFKSWPAFQNTAVRALAQLMATMPEPQHDSLADEVDRIRALVRDAEQAEETVVEDAPEDQDVAPGQHGGRQEEESV